MVFVKIVKTENRTQNKLGGISMSVKKNMSQESKETLAKGAKEIVTAVIPVVATGIASIAVGLINKNK